MDFALVITVLLTYFIRPQDWVPGMSGLRIMNLLMAAALLAMFLRRGGFSAASLVKTPVDWAVFAYGLYIILTSPSDSTPFTEVAVLLAYFAVTSQALSTPERLFSFLRTWMIGLLVVAGMAVVSEYGLDLTNAREITHSNPEEPRLVLNTYHYNNPNALGHGVITLIPLAYTLLFWKKDGGSKVLSLLVIAVAILCVYMTKSKGAFIVGFVLISATFLIGRPLLFQLLALLIVATLGIQGLKQLPRMTDMDNMRRDEAIMGRMIAWERARMISKDNPSGVGFKRHEPFIEWEGETVKKSTHSSYVLIGAELGTRGMLFYLAVMFACLRFLVTTRCEDPRDEASRRAMILILLGYMASGWLIDRSYHLEYFFLAGAVSAFHRRLGITRGVIAPADDSIQVPEHLPATSTEAEASPSMTSGYHGESVLPSTGESPQSIAITAAQPAGENQGIRFWHRWGWLDLILLLLLTKMVFVLWDRMLENYFY